MSSPTIEQAVTGPMEEMSRPQLGLCHAGASAVLRCVLCWGWHYWSEAQCMIRGQCLQPAAVLGVAVPLSDCDSALSQSVWACAYAMATVMETAGPSAPHAPMGTCFCQTDPGSWSLTNKRPFLVPLFIHVLDSVHLFPSKRTGSPTPGNQTAIPLPAPVQTTPPRPSNSIPPRWTGMAYR